MTRYAFYAIVLAAAVWVVFTVRSVSGQPIPAADPAPLPPTDEPTLPAASAAPAGPPVGAAAAGLETAALRRRVRFEHARYLAARRRVKQLTRTLQHRSSTREAIELACVTYGDCATLWRRARCETGGTLSPSARNRVSGAAGLYQFLPSTWQTTPFASLSVWSPYANALAAGWMNAHGRGSEWVCR